MMGFESGYSQNIEKYTCFNTLNSKFEVKKFLFKRYGFDRKDFENGDIIADVGAGNGYVSGMISCLYDNLSFYIQDIDTSYCNESEVRKVFDHYARIKGRTDTKYEIVIGQPHKSCLPERRVNKIIMCSVFHFILDPYRYFLNLKSKLRDGGKLYIVNFYAEDENSRGKLISDNNVYYEPTLQEIIEPIESAGFKFIKIHQNKNSIYSKLIFVFHD
jgi:SAM-dependent methyltransferase